MLKLKVELFFMIDPYYLKQAAGIDRWFFLFRKMTFVFVGTNWLYRCNTNHEFKTRHSQKIEWRMSAMAYEV